MIDGDKLYFVQQKKLRGDYPDVFQYDDLPEKLKVQIIYIWSDYIKQDHPYDEDKDKYGRFKLQKVYKTLCEELGQFYLLENEQVMYLKIGNYRTCIENFFMKESDIEIALTVVQLMMMLIEDIYVDKRADDAINKLNRRFKEHGVGYQYENGQIIRVDSQLIHAEVVKPALQLLSNPLYKGAQDEFLKAHEYYRLEDYKSMMVECLKAYESTLKVIIQKHGWSYNPKDTVDALTGKVMQNGLIPEYWKQYFKGLKNTLTAGLPTARNNEGGHGQGDEIKTPPDYLASYVLHMTASAIVFLAKAEEALD